MKSDYNRIHMGGKMTRAQGRKETIAYRQGKRLTQRQAILAKCYECMGNYEDGKVDCEIPDCPLYPYMPFGKKVMERKAKKMAANKVANPVEASTRNKTKNR